jgi:hypothetical protein
VKIGTVTGSEIRKNRDGQQNVVVLQVTMNDADDVQSVELMPTPGKDYRPRPGAKVFIMDSGAAYKIAITGRDEIEPSAAVGEQKIYSLDSAGLVAAIIHWMEDGQLVLNMGGGTAVEFKRLKTEFEKLQNAWDAFATAYVPGGPLAVGAPPTAAASMSVIDNAESPTVNLP